MCVPHRQEIHASHRMREVIQQTVIQKTNISSIFIRKPNKKQDKQDEYTIIINSMLKNYQNNVHQRKSMCRDE